MLHKLRRVWFSLNGRLMICLAASIVGMAAITMQAFYESWRDSRNQAYEEFTVVGTKMQSELTDTFDGYENAARLAGYSTAVQRYLLADDPELVIQSFTPALNYLDTVIQLSGSCLNICLYSYNGRHLYANTSYADAFRTLLNNRGFDRDVTISRPFFARVPGDGDSSLVFYCVPVYSLAPPHSTNRIIAAVLCDMNQIAQRISVPDEESPDAAVLLYSGGIVSATRSLKDGERDMLSSIPEDRGSLTYLSTKYLTTRISMPEKYWDFIYFTPESELVSKALRSMNQGLFPLCASILLISAFLALLLRSVNKSIQQIAGDMNALNYGKQQPSPAQIREPRLTELQAISHSANRMLNRLNEAFQQEQQTQERLYEAVHAQSRAEMMGYRSQINPHFLFNTLECMRSMAHSSGEGDMESLISSMALMFRYSLYSGTMVRFSQELSHVRNYFNVMRIRFPGRYALKIAADGDTLDCTVLSMVLQPIVENAVKHAFPGQSSLGNIFIKAFRNEKGALVVRVADNGVGLSSGELTALEGRMRRGEGEPLEGRNSIGLHNIYQRMKLTFGNHFHIRFRSRKGFYTVVELTIPKTPALPLFEANGRTPEQ